MTTTKTILPQASMEAVREIFHGKTIAFTAVVAEGGFGLGVTLEGEPGYWPIPTDLASSKSWEAMNDAATTINRFLGLSDEDAMRIVTSTMAAQNTRDRQNRKR